MKISGQLFVGKGTKLYSDMDNVLFTLTDDTCGRHDTIGGCCGKESNFVRYGVKEGPNCRDNFLRALAKFGLGKPVNCLSPFGLMARTACTVYQAARSASHCAAGRTATPSRSNACLA